MRAFEGLMLFFIVACGVARAADKADELYRPQANVARDPPAYYSTALFAEKAEPQPGDWMLAHPELPQSFRDYVRSKPIRPTQRRHVIILMPLGRITPEARARFDTLREFLSLYYTLPVRMEGWRQMRGVTSREQTVAGRTVRQYLTTDILSKVLCPCVREGTFCLLGVTMDDLYPEDSWNYVFGQASLKHRVGVYSLTRFYPEFWGDEDSPEADRLGLTRSLKTLVHETGHIFGIRHCQKYECVMNGSNSLREADSRPMHLCPACLKKFRWNIGFDIIGRCEALKAFYEAHEMADEAEWVGKRLAECRDSPAEGTGGDAAPDAVEDNAEEE